MSNELATIERTDGAIQQSTAGQANPIAAMLQAITEKGITQESAAALEKMTDLYLKVEAVNARKAFAEAKRQLQAEMPHVTAQRAVPNNDGTIRYVYAEYKTIMRAVEPLLTKHGFTISFSQRIDDSRLTAICTLTHIEGHSESNEFAVRAGKGPPGSSEAQADGSASTYAKRFALCNCLNIVIDNDDDARSLGPEISPEQATSLRRRLAAVKGDEGAFLRMAGAESFETIRQGKYAALEDALLRKEARVKNREQTGNPAEDTQQLADHFAESFEGSNHKDCQTFEIWLEAMRQVAMDRQIQPDDFDDTVRAAKLKHPLVGVNRKNIDARAAVLAAYRAGKLAENGTIKE